MDATSPEVTRWLGKLSALNVDAAKPTRAIGAAPHKPLLLLIVCDLVEEGALVGGLLHRDGALAFRFGTYWRIVADRRRTKPDLRLPFYHVRSDGFWQPLEADGRPAETRERAILAQLDVPFLVCLQDAEFRAVARRTLIAKYFEPAERAELYSLVGLPVPPDDIVAADATRFLPSDGEEKKRDAKFSVRVLPAYDFTCALTRYRMIAIDGTTPLDAAHIHQFKRGGSCHPTNGLALSKTAHWLFDRGYWSLDDNFRILVAAHKFDESGDVAQLLKPRKGTPILLPPNSILHPEPANLRWHRERHGFAA
jgi:putative restriction endonuclease